MKEFWVDFSGYIRIEAESKHDAEVRAWELYEFITNPKIISGEIETTNIQEVKEGE